MIRADSQQGMESVSQFKMNTVTEHYWLIYAAATVIHYDVGYYFQSLINLLRFHALLIKMILSLYENSGLILKHEKILLIHLSCLSIKQHGLTNRVMHFHDNCNHVGYINLRSCRCMTEISSITRGR